MTTAKRARLSAGARRAQLIELGLQLLATRTLDELSVEALAEEAGVSRGLLFHYFRSKQEFHLEVAQAAAQALLERTEPDLSLPPQARLRASLSAFIDYVVANKDGYVSLVRGAASGDETMRTVSERTRDQLATRVTDNVGALGLPLTAESELAIHGWIAFIEEVVVRWLRDSPIEREHLLNMLTNALPALVLASGDVPLSDLAAAMHLHPARPPDKSDDGCGSSY